MAARGFRFGLICGVLAGLADSLLAVAQTGGGAPAAALTAIFVSVSFWGLVGGCGLAFLFRLAGGRGGRASLKKTAAFAISAILLASAAGFFIGRTVILVSGLENFAGLAVGFPAAVAAAAAFAFGFRRIPVPKKARFGRAAAALGLAAGVVVLAASDTAKYQLRKIDTKDPARSPSAVRPRAAAGAPNILLIVLDTARADHLSISGYERETTPFLRVLAGESLVYERAVSPSPWTMPAHASIFTGQYPSVHQATFAHRFLSSDLVTLAEILKKSGYATAGFSANPNVSRAFNFNQGFDDFYELFKLNGLWDVAGLDPLAKLRTLKGFRTVLGISQMKGSDRAAEQTEGFVSRWLDGRKAAAAGEPFFIFINYLPPHLPYHPPAAYRERFLDRPLSPAVRELTTIRCFPAVWSRIAEPASMRPDDYAALAGLYDGELAFCDACVERLIEAMRGRGLLDNTVVVVTSDHGENLGEHGGLLNHSFSIHQTVLRVPLLVHYPKNINRIGKYPGLVSTGSIFPTVLKLAGAAPAADWPSAFPSLPESPTESGPETVISEYELPLLELAALDQVPGADIRPYAVSQRAIQDGRWKLVSRSDGKAFLFDLAADAGEDSPLAAASPDGVRLLKMLDDWRTGLRIPHFSPESSVPAHDKRTIELLKSLGYVR